MLGKFGVIIENLGFAIAKTIVAVYKLLFSWCLGYRCRYYPSCSEYFTLAVKKYGILKGPWVAALRLCRCNSFFKGGYDPC